MNQCVICWEGLEDPDEDFVPLWCAKCAGTPLSIPTQCLGLEKILIFGPESSFYGIENID
jgi:hypothetical protein